MRAQARLEKVVRSVIADRVKNGAIIGCPETDKNSYYVRTAGFVWLTGRGRTVKFGKPAVFDARVLAGRTVVRGA